MTHNPQQLQHTKRTDGLSQLPTSFIGPKAYAKLLLIFYLFPDSNPD